MSNRNPSAKALSAEEFRAAVVQLNRTFRLLGRKMMEWDLRARLEDESSDRLDDRARALTQLQEELDRKAELLGHRTWLTDQLTWLLAGSGGPRVHIPNLEMEIEALEDAKRELVGEKRTLQEQKARLLEDERALLHQYSGLIRDEVRLGREFDKLADEVQGVVEELRRLLEEREKLQPEVAHNGKKRSARNWSKVLSGIASKMGKAFSTVRRTSQTSLRSGPRRTSSSI